MPQVPIVRTVKALRARVSGWQSAGERVALVPTMGALHAGHIALMDQATRNGAVIMPPVPAFYQRPATVQDIVDQTVGRALDLFDLDSAAVKRWDGGQRGRPRGDEGPADTDEN
jgi:4-hydroxy-3-polyprenylbenzoate decarboxylase